nr:putative ribonuclease H-like domain-containing protein [Tanacetum cinerariifolium]
MLNVDVEPLAPKLLNNRIIYSNYLRHTQEQVAILREVVEQGKSQNPLNNSLDHACMYKKRIQELLILIKQTCPNINGLSGKLVAMTPMNKSKRVRFTEPVTSSGNTNTKTASLSNLVSNNPALFSTGVKQSTSASGSQPSGNTKKDKIQRPPRSTQKNKVEAHLRTVKYSLKTKNCVVKPQGTASVQYFKLNANSELICVKCNGCMLSDNHDLCVLNDVNALENACPLTSITTTTEVSSRKPIAVETNTLKPVVTLFYSKKPRKSKSTDPVSKSKVGISHATSVARSPQQNGFVERRNHMLIKATGTMLIYAKAPLFLWAEAVATAYFDELTAMASEQSSSGPALHEMTLATISSGHVRNPPPSIPFVPPSRTDWDMLFQPLFDELLTLPPSVDHPAREVIAPITEVIAPEPVASTGSPSITTVEQDASSPSNSQTTPETQSPIIPTDVEEDNHDLDIARMNNDPFFDIPI